MSSLKEYIELTKKRVQDLEKADEERMLIKRKLTDAFVDELKDILGKLTPENKYLDCSYIQVKYDTKIWIIDEFVPGYLYIAKELGKSYDEEVEYYSITFYRKYANEDLVFNVKDLNYDRFKEVLASVVDKGWEIEE